jgi:hypothetical protein
MSLIPCPECTKEISSQASSCPHCGAPAKANATAAAPAKKTRKSHPISYAVLALIVIAGIWAYFDGSKKEEEQAAAAAAAKDAACATDLQCSGDKYQRDAEGECRPLLQAKGKAIAKWDFKLGEGGMFDFLLERFRWTDDTKTQLVYTGSRAKFQNGFGAWQQVDYECRFDIASKKAVDASFKAPRT